MEELWHFSRKKGDFRTLRKKCGFALFCDWTLPESAGKMFMPQMGRIYAKNR